MKNDILYRQEIGMIFDTINVLRMKLNDRSLWVNQIIQKNNETKDFNYINYWLDQYEDIRIPDELIIFFYLKNQKSHGFFIYSFVDMLERKNGVISIDDIIQYIENEEGLKEDISNFYLEEKITDLSSFEKALKKRSDINKSLCYYLLSFFVDPVEYIVKLKDVIQACYSKTHEIYSEKATSILKWQEKISGTKLYDLAAFYSSEETAKQSLNDGKDCIYYSVSIIDKNSIIFEIERNTKWFILGIEYQEQVKEDEELVIDVAAVGNAFGDLNRLRILEAILKNGEITVSNIANMLGLAVNVVSYHLDIMKKADLLRSRSKGKSTVYWLNTKACEIISTLIESWAQGGDSIEATVEKASSHTVKSLDNE